MTNSLSISSSINSLPLQSVSIAEKESERWQKEVMDFMSYEAKTQISDKIEDIRKLRLLNGEFDVSNYRYLMDPLNIGRDKDKNYGSTLEITHYPILTRPINTIVGEAIKRPLNFYCRSESSKSRNEYYRIKGEMLTETVTTSIMDRVKQMAQSQGIDLQTEQGQSFVQAHTPSAIQDYMDRDYCDISEQVSNRILNNLWKRESLNLEFVEGFKTGVSIGKEFYHTYVQNGKTKIKNVQSPDVFFHKSSNARFISEGQYAGIRSYLTPSSVIDMFYEDLTVDDVLKIEAITAPHPRSQSFGIANGRDVGTSTIKYETDRYINPEGHMFADYYTNEIKGRIEHFQKYGTSSNYYDTRGLIEVVQAYWQSYRKVGFMEDANGTVSLIDENFKPNSDLGQTVKWCLIPQLYEGTKIGEDIYINVRPYKYQSIDINNIRPTPLPIDGMYYNNNYSKPIGLIDLMLPWNELYDIVAYELKKDMNSSLGKVMFMSIDHIPNIPGFDMEKWYYWVRELKVAWVKNPTERNSFAHFQSADMSFAEQMMAKMKILEAIKNECGSIAGFSEPRLGNTSAESTLGQSSQSLVASVNQTEYWFFKHSSLAQRVLTNAVNLEKKLIKDNPTLRNLLDDVEQKYIDIDGYNLDEDIHVYLTNSSDDLRKKEQIDNLVQAAMSKGEDNVDLLELILSGSISETKNIYERLRKNRQQAQSSAQQADQEYKNAELDFRKEELSSKETLEREKMRSNEDIAYMKTFAMQDDNMKDTDGSGLADVLEFNRFAEEQKKNSFDQSLSQRKMLLEEQKAKDAVAIANQKNKTDRFKAEVTLKNKVSGEK